MFAIIAGAAHTVRVRGGTKGCVVTLQEQSGPPLGTWADAHRLVALAMGASRHLVAHAHTRVCSSTRSCMGDGNDDISRRRGEGDGCNNEKGPCVLWRAYDRRVRKSYVITGSYHARRSAATHRLLMKKSPRATASRMAGCLTNQRFGREIRRGCLPSRARSSCNVRDAAELVGWELRPDGSKCC